MKTEIISITPSVAAILLEGNTYNRPLNSRTVQAYSETMRRGAWKLNGEAIKVASDGTLIDGQHRLSAIIKAGVNVDCLLITNLDANVFDTLDIGKRRGMSDVLSISGEQNATVLSGILRLLCLHQQSPTGFPMANAVPIDIQEKYLRENPDVRIYATKCGRVRHVCDGSIIGAFWYLFSQKSGEDAEDFFSRLIDGVNLSADSPIKLLRDRLLMNRAAKVSKLQRKTVAALIIKAWNSYRLGKPMKQLKWSDEESFPEII